MPRGSRVRPARDPDSQHSRPGLPLATWHTPSPHSVSHARHRCHREGTHAMANDRDPRTDLGAWLGEELRNARADAGYKSQDALARELGFDRTVIDKAETGERPPSEDVAAKIAEKFPGLANGLYVQLAAIARKSNGKIPRLVRRDWLHVSERPLPCGRWEPIKSLAFSRRPTTRGRCSRRAQPASSEDDLDDWSPVASSGRTSWTGQSHPICGWCWTRRLHRHDRVTQDHECSASPSSRYVRSAAVYGPGRSGQHSVHTAAWRRRIHPRLSRIGEPMYAVDGR